MLFYRMTLVPLRLFHNNLSNLQEFFGQVAHPSPPPPWQKMIALVVKPLNVQESVSADSEAPDIMFICPMVDYGIHAYIGAVKCTFMSKFCFCVLMEQIVGSCCEVKIKNDVLCFFWYVLETDVSANYNQVFYFPTRLKSFFFISLRITSITVIG